MMYLQSTGMFPLAVSGNVEGDVLNKNPGTADMSPLKYAFECTLEILKELKAATMAPFDPWIAKGTLNLWALTSALPLPASISPDTNQGVCHSLHHEEGRGKSCARKPTSAVRHSEKYVNTGTVPEKWGSILEMTGSRSGAYRESPCQLGGLYQRKGNRSAA